MFRAWSIRPLSNKWGTGLALDQHKMKETVAQMMIDMGEDPKKVVYSPKLKAWSFGASSLLRHEVSPANTSKFLRLLGGIGYQMNTGMCHPIHSLLSHQSGGPTPLDTQAAVQVGQFHQKIGHIPLTFYRNPTANDYSIPMPIHVDVDAGECGRLDGQGQYGLIIRVERSY